MKKILLALALFSIFNISVSHAQTSKEINKIKRSTAYLYSEATMADAQEAAAVAYELLMKQVEEYISSKRKLSQADNVLIKDIKSRSEQLSMMRGEMHRVFVYVKKSDIEGVENTTVVNNASGATVAINSQPTSLTPSPSPVGEGSREQPHQSEIQEHLAPSHSPTREGEPTSLTPQPPLLSREGEQDATEPLPSPERRGAGGEAASTLPAWQQQAIADMLDCADLAAVRAKLSRLKAQYKVKRFGAADRCPDAAEACWAIFDSDGRLTTILGPGAQSRIDYRTMQETTLDAYKGMNALWFNFSK